MCILVGDEDIVSIILRQMPGRLVIRLIKSY